MSKETRETANIFVVEPYDKPIRSYKTVSSIFVKEWEKCMLNYTQRFPR